MVPFEATYGLVTVPVSGSSNGLLFTVVPPLPVIITFAPMGTVVTLTGTDFVGATAAAFNGVSAPFTFVLGTALTATVPAATGDFRGLLNTGPLTRGATANAGWQLLGNPYPAPLDWAVVEATPGALPPGLGAAIYVFEPTSQYGGFYRSYVGGVGTGGLAGRTAGNAGLLHSGHAGSAGRLHFPGFVPRDHLPKPALPPPDHRPRPAPPPAPDAA